MALTSNERLQERFSLALEQRSKGYVDLVSNANVILYMMKKRGMRQSFSGPTIRERLLYNETGSYTRYSGFDFLNPTPVELINDAEWTPKMGAVSVTLSNEDILRNSGENQLIDLMTTHIMAAETELVDRFVEDVHSDGTGDNQITGLQAAIPTTPSSGTYAGISRVDNAEWRTGSYDAHSYFSGYTQVNSSSVRHMFETIVIQHSRGTKGPNLICASQQHFQAYSAATVAIQRINDSNELGGLGFTALKFYGGGRSLDLVLEGGIGSAMPDDVSYFIDTAALKYRYHPDRDFTKIGGKQMPINQDAIVQHIGFMGELTLTNPLHTAKLYDSTPGS